jgi:hypothetical protein
LLTDEVFDGRVYKRKINWERVAIIALGAVGFFMAMVTATLRFISL